MLIPPDVLQQTAARIDFDPRRRRADLSGKTPIEANDPQRIQTWLARAAPELPRGETLERIINGNDLMQINYLDRGMLAAKSVGRISIGDASGQVVGYGTGFMIAPRLLLTNHHVFPDANTASHSFIRFNYQLDANGNKTNPEDFDFQPEACFVTSGPLDFTVVAVKENAALSKYGFLPLDATPGKTLDAQYLTIIQHPSGERKQIAIRENQLIKTMDNFLWYATDTAPGSSGSCVFNDAWQVVALHHSGVPDKVDVDGKPFTDATPDDKVKWIANEGVRISSIAKELQKSASVPLVKALLATIAGLPKPESTVVAATPGPGVAPSALQAPSAEKISIDPNYDDRHGYDPAFLGTGDKRVPLPRLSAEQMQDAALKLDDDGQPAHVLAYHHYSVVMNKARRLAYFTAVNIDGSVSFRIKRETDRWIPDPRIAPEAQAGEELYTDNDFDRGHLVRRLDPAWGETLSVAKVANDDTFHYTNCSPQHKKFNEGQNLWAGLEDYVLNNAQNNDLKVTVFTGPIFRDDDQEYRGIRIPHDFWKVVVMARAGGKLSATAYIVSQSSLIAGLPSEAFAGYGQYRTFQVPVKTIADLTTLDFGKLPSFDPKAAAAPTESALAATPLRDYAQIAV